MGWSEGGPCRLAVWGSRKGPRQTRGVDMKEIRTGVEITAAPETVWEILTDFRSYPTWNPFIVEAAGDLAPGGRLKIKLKPPGRRGFTFRPTVLQVEARRELRWLGRTGVRGVFDGEHTHSLEALTGGRTRYTQSELFRGMLTPFVGGLLRDTKKGFEAMNAALKARAEARG